jgi:hypothetical protein
LRLWSVYLRFDFLTGLEDEAVLVWFSIKKGSILKVFLVRLEEVAEHPGSRLVSGVVGIWM